MNTLCAIYFSRIKNLSWDKKFLQVATFNYNILFKFVLVKRVLFSLLVANNPLGLFIDKHDPILLRKLVAVCYALKQTQQIQFLADNQNRIVRTMQ